MNANIQVCYDFYMTVIPWPDLFFESIKNAPDRKGNKRMQDARITFYSVAKCGFYKRGEKGPSFGGLADTFQQLADWSNGLELSLTKLIDAAPDAVTMPVYVLEMVPCGAGWMLACWNEVPSKDGNITSVSKNSIVGAPLVHLNEVVENSIPGYATYFWIIPEKDVIASIKFSDFTTGLKAMSGYVSDFLMLESTYAIDATDAEGQPYIAGYTDKADNIPTAAKPRFKLIIFSKKGRRTYLLENHAKIKKVLRVGRVTLLRLGASADTLSPIDTSIEDREWFNETIHNREAI